MLKWLKKHYITIDGTPILVNDINTHFIIKTSVKNMAVPLQTFRINPWDSPQSVAYSAYKDTKLDWLILLAANIIDEYREWPKDNDDVQKYCNRVYSTGENGIHHYENIHGEIVDHFQQYRYINSLDEIPAHINPITNYQYELSENDKRKIIQIFSPDSVQQILEKIEEALK